jgi:hypothetical protein
MLWCNEVQEFSTHLLPTNHDVLDNMELDCQIYHNVDFHLSQSQTLYLEKQYQLKKICLIMVAILQQKQFRFVERKSFTF